MEEIKETLISTHFYSTVYFGPSEDYSKSRRFAIQLFERGIISSIHHRNNDGSFERKADKTCYISNNDFSEIVLMLKQAYAKAKDEKAFEYVIPAKETAIGIFGFKEKDSYIGGFAIYDVKDGIVIQNSKIVCPIQNKAKVRHFSENGEMTDVIQSALLNELRTLIDLFSACLNGTSAIMSYHNGKMAKKNSGNFKPKEVNVSVDETYINEDKEEDEYPF